MNIKERIGNIESKTREWMERHADGTGAQVWLSAISFFEASILPLPPSAFMVSMLVLGSKHRWIYLALLTTVTSVLGGIFGYIIGASLYDPIGVWIIENYHLADDVARIGELFANNAFVANLVGAFTPIPYKAFTIASGFFSINLFLFTLASFIGRGLRFFILAYLSVVFGEHVAKRVFKFFALTTLMAIIVMVLVLGVLSF